VASIEELESSIDIVELVKRYAKLQKAGANWKALCPFPGHNEKTPSLIVSPSKQIAYCFGCHRGGWPLKFIMDVENCQFREAVDILSSITGVRMPHYDQKKENHKKNIYSLMKDIGQYYQNALKKHPKMLKYLTSRGLTDETIEIFWFGYADSGVELLAYLREKNYEDSLIEESRVFLDIRTKKDKFLGRIIFPIRNNRWDTIAFAGRIVGSGEPKYLNSPASELYDKSSILYGLYEARNTIVKTESIILTEGYMDTIALHQAGYKNAVCISGTALTVKHIPMIKKFTSRVYLCFDQDNAGRNATNSAIETLKNQELEVKIILLPSGKDPDEFIKLGWNFSECIQNALSPIGYLLRTQEYSGHNEKKEIAEKLLNIVKNYRDDIERDEYLKEISHTLGIQLDIIYKMYKNIRTSAQSIPTQERKTAFRAEDILISVLLESPDFLGQVRDEIQYLAYVSHDLQEVIRKGIEVIENFPLEKKNMYQAIPLYQDSLQIHAQTNSEQHTQKNLQKLIATINAESFQKASEILQQKVKSGDKQALTEYMQILQQKKLDK